jgi:hypothetical protein
MDVLVVMTPDAELDDEAGERLSRQLRRELAELAVDSVRAAPGEALPDGAKGADPVTVGAIILAMSASGGVFTAVIETLRDWLGRQSRRHRISMTIDGDTIELERATAEQQSELLAAYIQRHSVE